MGSTSRSPPFPLHIRKDTGAGAAPSRGERCRRMVSSRAADLESFPSCSIVSGEARALGPQPGPTNTAGEEQGPVGVCSLGLGCSCASSRACSERLRNAVGAKGWQGLQMGGPAGGWDGRGERSAHAFARSPCVFPLLCQQLLSWKDFISPAQRATLDASRHRSQPTLARMFSLSPVSKETARACLIPPLIS